MVYVSSLSMDLYYMNGAIILWVEDTKTHVIAILRGVLHERSLYVTRLFSFSVFTAHDHHMKPSRTHSLWILQVKWDRAHHGDSTVGHSGFQATQEEPLHSAMVVK